MQSDSAAAAAASPIENLDFVGDLNGTTDPSESTESTAINSGVSFGDNEVRTFETDASERRNEYESSSHDDADDDDDNGRINIGGDIKLDTLDIHTINDNQTINAPPLLDDIEVLA
jgi:hypothetical protein